MQDYVVSVITLHFLVPKPGKKVPRDAELWSDLLNWFVVREWMCGLCTLVRKHAVYESASRPEAWRYRDAIVQFWVSAVSVITLQRLGKNAEENIRT
jgi:hypothetical protein